MKYVLQAEEIKPNKEEYFDAIKNVYNPVPVFPFLTEEDIENGIETLVDVEVLKKEIATLAERSKSKKNTIEGSTFIICLVGWHEYPELIKMLTIVREWAFRNGGGGVGSNDYDKSDFRPEMQQLIIINPEFKDIKGCIIGGYRFVIHNRGTYTEGPMGAHFGYSENWLDQIWIELGRSFINPYFQSTNRKHSIDYVLHGLGYIHANYPETIGYFGKVTLFNIYEQLGADAFFLGVAKEYFAATDDIWVNGEERVPEGNLTHQQREILDRGTFKGLFYILKKEYKVNLVPIMAVYNRMTDLKNMYYYGAFRHKEFGNTTEVGIAIKCDDLYDVIVEKFIDPYRD